MEDLSLHILDIAENSVAAGAHTLRIIIREDIACDLLSIEIADDGKGMTAEVVAKVTDPFYTTRTTRKVGLGLALMKEAAMAANGGMTINSEPDSGTSVKATFQLSHIDRKPLGSMAETVIALIATHADLDVVYEHTRDGKALVFDTREVRSQLGGGSLNTVEALGIIRNFLAREESTLAL